MATPVELEGACPECGSTNGMLVNLDLEWVVLSCADCGAALDPSMGIDIKPPRPIVDTPTGDHL